MKKRNLRLFLAILSSLVFLSGTLFMAGCTKKSNSDDITASDNTPRPGGTTSLEIRVDLKNLQSQRRVTKNAVGTVDEVHTVKVIIEENGVPGILQEIDLTETTTDSNIWTGTFTNLPVGVGLDFSTIAYNISMQAIFQDDGSEINKVLTTVPSNDDIIFKMESIDDSTQPDNPKITSVTIPLEIQADSTDNTILFNIEHSGNVLYYVTVNLGSMNYPTPGVWATFNPASGGLEISYDASSEQAIDTITLKVKDPVASDTVGLSAPIRVVDHLADSNISILFGPVITGMEFLRTPDDLSIAVKLDSASNPAYEWVADGNFENLYNPHSSQATIAPFTNSNSGTIKVVVTDTNGIQSSLTRDISDGGFPYIGHELVEFQELQTIDTNGSWEYFTIDGESYLAVANHMNATGTSCNTDSKIYKWNDSSFDVFESIPTSCATKIKHFTIDGESYLAVANMKDDSGWNGVESKIYKWNGISFAANEVDSITTIGAQDLEYFTIDGESYLAVASYTDGSTYNLLSYIYKWSDSSFDEANAIAISTSAVTDFEYFSIDGKSYLGVANAYNGSSWSANSNIYIWNGSSFDSTDSITTYDVSDLEYFTVNGENYLAVANNYNGSSNNIDSHIYKWENGAFVNPVSVLTHGAHSWKHFSIGGDHYLAVANYYNGSSYNIESKIYKWSNGVLSPVSSILTNGASWDLEYFTILGKGYLAVTNSKGNSIIYKAILNDYGVLLMHMDGEGQIFKDTLPSKHPITAFGNVDQSMDYPSKFGKSAYFDSTGDYLSVASSPDFDFGVDPFTVEFWVYPNDATTGGALFTLDSSNDQVLAMNIFQNDIQLGVNNSWSASDSDIFGASGQWYHVAVVRESVDAIKVYVNGTLAHTVNGLTGVSISGNGNPLYIGRVDSATSSYFSGYIDELRISKGVARWLTDFTPPNAPY